MKLMRLDEFINKTEKDGCVFCCDDDINLKNILKEYKNKYILIWFEGERSYISQGIYK